MCIGTGNVIIVERVRGEWEFQQRYANRELLSQIILETQMRCFVVFTIVLDSKTPVLQRDIAKFSGNLNL